MSKRRKEKELKEVEEILHDLDARKNGPNKKTFHLKDLVTILPKTTTQTKLFDQFHNTPGLALTGSAGTGKTFLSIYLALREVLLKNYKKLIIVRSCVPARDLGFTPGTLEEKMAVYELPYQAIMDEIFQYKNAYENLKKTGLVEFVSTSYLRGVTFNNTIVVVDEMQNLNFAELETVTCRIGENSKLILCGDHAQNDLYRHKKDSSGFHDYMKIVSKLDTFSIITFNTNDIVRSEFVKKFLIEKERSGS